MTKDIRKPLGAKIKQYRKERGYSQEALAELLNISPTAMSNIETGRSFVSHQVAQKLLDIFKIEPYELFLFVNIEPEKIIIEQLDSNIKAIKKNPDKLKLLFDYTEKLKHS